MTSISSLRTIERLSLFSGEKIVRIGPSMFRKFVCAPGCSACCMQGPLTLDFIPVEPEWQKLPSTIQNRFSPVTIMDRVVYSLEKPRGMCHFLQPFAGGMGCGIWQTHPLECWAAARIQVQTFGDEVRILKKGFAREWRWEVHAQCQYPKFEWEQSELDADLSVLNRYLVWAEYFGIETIIPRMKETLARVYEVARLNEESSPIVDRSILV